jgi:hypothetical protein
MSIIDRIRELFGGKKSGVEYTAAAGVAVAATSNDDPAGDVESQSGSGSSGGGESGGDGGGGDAGGGGTSG